VALRQTHSQSHAAHGGRIGAAAPQRETSQLQRSYIYVRSNTDRKCTLRLLWSWRGAQSAQSCSRSHSRTCRFGYGGPYPSMWRHLCANAQGIVLRSSVPARSKKCTVLRRDRGPRPVCLPRSLHCSVRAPFSLLRYRLATHMEVRHAQPVFSLGLRAAWLMYVPSLWSRNARSARSWPHRRRHRHTVVRSKCSTACSP